MNNPLSREARDAMRARVEAATPGPWHVNVENTIYADANHIGICETDFDAAEVQNSGPDAEFIAAARSDVPTLLDALESAEALVSTLGRGLTELVRHHENLVLEITERHDGVEYPADELGYAKLPDDYVSALAHSGDTMFTRAALASYQEWDRSRANPSRERFMRSVAHMREGTE